MAGGGSVKYFDVSVHDKMVVDSQGTIWVHNFDYWMYLTDEGQLSEWDARVELPVEYEYHQLDKAAKAIITKGLVST
jgi:hypothetical protein